MFLLKSFKKRANLFLPFSLDGEQFVNAEFELDFAGMCAGNSPGNVTVL